jgi:hypothetical protein
LLWVLKVSQTNLPAKMFHFNLRGAYS